MTPEQLLERLEAVERGATGPPTVTGERVWGAIEARLLNGPPPQLDDELDDELDHEIENGSLLEQGAEAAAHVGGSSSVALKIVGVLAIVGAVGGGLALLNSRDRAPEPIAAAVEPEQGESATEPESSPEPDSPEPESPEPESSPEPKSLEPSEPPPTEAKPVGATSKIKTQPKVPAPPKSLADEVALMQALSTALKQGDSRKVLTLVTEHERDFIKGQFIEERRAAKARALCQAGKQAAGEKEAASFASKWPSSIHLASVKQDCGID